jgi:hypothetical protein
MKQTVLVCAECAEIRSAAKGRSDFGCEPPVGYFVIEFLLDFSEALLRYSIGIPLRKRLISAGTNHS